MCRDRHFREASADDDSSLRVFFGCYAWIGIDRLRETAQETQAREAAESQEAARHAAASAKAAADRESAKERIRLLCKTKVVCARYAEVRQECATAGSFQTCIQVKMGDENYESIGSCSNDGHLIDASSEPGSVDCFFN